MKLDFGNINESNFNVGSVFFLYGNFKRSFDVFCDFLTEKLKTKFYGAELNVNYCSVVECTKIINAQCDLFGNNLNLFCIRNVEDNHLDKLTPLFSSVNSIFVLESGDYRKSKSITDYFTKNRDAYAVASFKNDATLMSLCKLILPIDTSTTICREIVRIINDTDEGLISLFKKISLLLVSQDEKLLQDYITYKTSFLQNMDFIPLARYLAKLALKAKVFDKKQEFVKTDLSQKHVIEKLLKAEINQKIGTPLTKSVLENL